MLVSSWPPCTIASTAASVISPTSSTMPNKCLPNHHGLDFRKSLTPRTDGSTGEERLFMGFAVCRYENAISLDTVTLLLHESMPLTSSSSRVAFMSLFQSLQLPLYTSKQLSYAATMSQRLIRYLSWIPSATVFHLPVFQKYSSLSYLSCMSYTMCQ